MIQCEKMFASVFKFICVLQVSEIKKGILVYFDKNVLEYFITLIFIALYEYCIESPSTQFTHRNLVYYVPLKKKSKEELSFKGG